MKLITTLRRMGGFAPLSSRMRKKSTHGFFRHKGFFAALLVLAAILVFTSSSKAEPIDRIVAVINDSIITLSEINAAAALAMDKLEGFDKKNPEKVKEMKSKMLDGLIEQKLIRQAADKAGIEVSEREIDNAVEDVKRQNNLTQEALLLALAQNGLTFKEYREQLKEQIRQVKFINKEFRSKISILPEDIEEYYNQHKDDFRSPAAYRLNLIFLPDKDKEVFKLKIKAVQDGLDKGEDFKELARSYSEGYAASSGGDTGYLTSGEMDKVLEDVASGLKPGGTSGPVATPEGVYFIQLVDLRPDAPSPIEDVKAKIQDRLYKKIMEDRFNFWLTEVKKYAHIEIRM